jgi:hypothetical protein
VQASIKRGNAIFTFSPKVDKKIGSVWLPSGDPASEAVEIAKWTADGRAGCLVGF